MTQQVVADAAALPAINVQGAHKSAYLEPGGPVKKPDHGRGPQYGTICGAIARRQTQRIY
jgi:hypothetical protein